MLDLQLNCEAYYLPSFLTSDEANTIYKHLIDDLDISNNRIKWYSGDELVYSDIGKIMFIDEHIKRAHGLPDAQVNKSFVWSDIMYPLKKRVDKLIGRSFHTSVCIYYPNGKAGVDFHSDLRAFGDTSIIPSISLGAERVFQLREKSTGKIFSKVLQHGSMIVMGNGCQDNYEHALPLDETCMSPRINLTFRPFGN